MTDDPNPLNLEETDFEPEEHPPPPANAAELELDDELDVPPPEPTQWDEERAGDVMRGVFLIVHVADPISREPGGEELWRLTEADAREIGRPLARIANRYEPVRRLAGFSDEAALAFALGTVAKKNLALRSRLVDTKRAHEEAVHPTDVLFDGAERTDEAPPTGLLGVD